MLGILFSFGVWGAYVFFQQNLASLLPNRDPFMSELVLRGFSV